MQEKTTLLPMSFVRWSCAAVRCNLVYGNLSVDKYTMTLYTENITVHQVVDTQIREEMQCVF